LGIGLAQRRCIRRRSIEAPLDAQGLEVARAALDALADDARGDLLRQDVATDAIRELRTVHVRLAGSDTSIELDWADEATLRMAFREAHERLYGFAAGDRALVIASAGAEAVEHSAPGLPAGATPSPGSAAQREAPRAVSAWTGGGWCDVALRDREELRTNDTVAGPALIIERGATVWVESGWTAVAGVDGLLRMRRTEDIRAATTAAGGAPDSTTLEIFNGLFMHVAEQMGVVLRQTASSVNIKERLDYSCALFDGAANLVANAPHMPVHLGSMGASVAAVIAAHGNDLRPGDAFLLNSRTTAARTCRT